LIRRRWSTFYSKKEKRNRRRVRVSNTQTEGFVSLAQNSKSGRKKKSDNHLTPLSAIGGKLYARYGGNARQHGETTQIKKGGGSILQSEASKKIVLKNLNRMKQGGGEGGRNGGQKTKTAILVGRRGGIQCTCVVRQSIRGRGERGGQGTTKRSGALGRKVGGAAL